RTGARFLETDLERGGAVRNGSHDGAGGDCGQCRTPGFEADGVAQIAGDLSPVAVGEPAGNHQLNRVVRAVYAYLGWAHLDARGDFIRERWSGKHRSGQDRKKDPRHWHGVGPADSELRRLSRRQSATQTRQPASEILR